MRRSISLVAGAILLLTLPAVAGVQAEPETLRTVEGTVVDVLPATPGEGPVELLVETEADRLSVRLGPQRYLAEHGFGADEGDRVRLAVRRCPHCGALVAGSAENLTAGTKLALREDDGLPLWRGSGKGGGQGCRRGMGPGKGQGPGHGRGQGRGARDGSGPGCPRV